MAAEYDEPKMSSGEQGMERRVNFLWYSCRDLVELLVTNMVRLPGVGGWDVSR